MHLILIVISIITVIRCYPLVLFSPREKKREVNYLWQWVIEISIITQPIYKLCTQRETKVGMVLSRKITYLPLVNLLNDLLFDSGLWLNSVTRILLTSPTQFLAQVNR